MNGLKRLWRRPFFIRLFNWEYWSFGTVYTAIYPVWFFLCFRARSFLFFSAANPSIKNGGFLAESKKDIHNIMPAYLYPATMHFDAGTDAHVVLESLLSNSFNYPLIGKPDTGGRGRGIKVLKNDEELINYVQHATVDFHIQKFIEYPEEVGIFYYRYPEEEKGHISGIVKKEFMAVTGDGISEMRKLLEADNRSLLHLKSLEKMYGPLLDTVLEKGVKKVLIPYGNHARGAKFLDDSSLADEKLLNTIEGICRQVKDFYFGRLDIRYVSWEELKEGKNFSVIEVNGAGSEPTHIYDPKHSLFFAWKEIIRHWVILWRISKKNHRRGYPYLTVKEGLRMFKEDRENSKKLEGMSD